MTNATQLHIVWLVTLQHRFDTIKENNYKLTKTRKQVLTLFEQEHRPLNAKDIITYLHENKLTVNKTTVYRELTFLHSLGFIKEVRIDDNEMHYETTSMDHHHHLVCKNCNAVEGVASNELEKEMEKLENDVLQEKGFKIDAHMLEFFGLCDTCQKGALA